MTVDKLGDTSEDFDLENIDISQLRGLLIRRSRLVKKGTPRFANEDLLNEWRIYPSTELDDLGFHNNACQMAILFWDGALVLEPEEERDEFFLFPVEGTLKSSEPLDDKCNVFIGPVAHEYQPFDEPAVQNEDYITSLDPTNNILLGQGFTIRDFEMLELIDDQICTNDLGIGFLVSIDETDCPANVSVDDLKKIWDIRIFDNETKSTTIILDSSEIQLNPTIVSNIIVLDSSNHEIEEVKLVSINGKIIKYFSDINSFNPVIEIGDVAYKGVVFVHIKTASGAFSIKKIYKN